MRRKRGQGAMLVTIGPEWRRLLFDLAMTLDVDMARATIDPRRCGTAFSNGRPSRWRPETLADHDNACRRDELMAQLFRDDADVHTISTELGGVCVPEAAAAVCAIGSRSRSLEQEQYLRVHPDTGRQRTEHLARRAALRSTGCWPRHGARRPVSLRRRGSRWTSLLDTKPRAIRLGVR